MRFLCIAACLSLFPLTQIIGEELILVVEAGEHDRLGTPLVAALPEKSALTSDIQLVPLDVPDAAPVPAQILPGKQARIVWTLARPLFAGQNRRYRVEAGNYVQGMQCEEGENGIDVGDGDRLILRYVKSPTAEATKNDPIYTRTGYIHPLITPGGQIVTGDYPADHPHQHALFNAWTNTSFEGRKINFWDQKSGHARIRFNDTRKKLCGPVFAQFVVTQKHEDMTDPEKPRPVLDETWMVRAWRANENFHLIDIKSSQRCATESPLTINQYHYGGMAIRGTAEWFDPDKNAEPPGGFLTSEGKSRADGNHSRPNWVAMHGPIGDESAGVAIFSHPENFRSPQWVRLHPTKPYFVFTPMVEEGFRIQPGTPYVAQYRYAVFDGNPDPSLLAQVWTDYAHPPKISIDTQP